MFSHILTLGFIDFMKSRNSYSMNNTNQKNTEKSDYFKITLTISDDLDELLVRIGNAARMQGGYKLPKTLIIRSLIRLLHEADVDVSNVKTEEEFYKRLKNVFLKNENI